MTILVPAAAPCSPAAQTDTPGEHPLSEGQRALWVLDRLDPGAAACHLAGAARVPEGLDGAALGCALQLLAHRHPALRTTFEVRKGEPVRRVRPWLEPDFAAADLASPAEISALLAAEAYRPFSLERGPLWRVRVWSLPGGAVLLVAIHHLIADFASVSILLRDLMELYRHESTGAPARLSLPGPGMTAWILRQEERLAGARGESLRAFWLRRLGRDLPFVELPVDRLRPATPTWRGIAVTTQLQGGAEALRAVGRSRGATLFATLLAGVQAVLHRWTGERKTLVGVPAARRGPGFAHEIGYFVNPVALRLDFGGEPCFADMVEAAGTVTREAFAHGAYPFARLARELHLEGNAGRSLLRVLAVLQPARTPEERALAPFALGIPGARAVFGELDLESVALPEERVQSDLLLMAAEAEDGALALSLRLAADLFDPATADRLLGHLAGFLRAATADPGRRAAEIDILSETERRQIAAWSAGPPLPREDLCLHERIAGQAARKPGAAALVHGEARLTYQELWDRASRLADHLRRLGVGPEARVGLCAGRTPEMVVGMLAVLEAGGAYVPLDLAYPAERLAFLLEDSGAALLLTDSAAANRLPATDLPRVRLDEAPQHGPPAPPPRRPYPESLAYLIYTSGSTGRPKAVAITHRSASALAVWARETFSERELDGVLAATSIGFDLSVFEILVPLCWGGRVVLAGSVLDLPEIPASAGVRLVNTVPSAIAELLKGGCLPASVETVNLAGEPLRRDLVRSLFNAGISRVVNLYGPSEDTTYSTTADQERDGEGEPPIGRPVAGTRAWVLDAALRPAPVGVAGELFLAGEGLARGYLGRPDLTAERFVPSPFAEDGPGARLYRTGDRVRWRPDGQLVFLGRLDHQVKIRGFRIEPGEIEAALVSHPEVGQAVVLALGEGAERRLVAYVAPGFPPLPGDRECGWERGIKGVRVFLAQRLPDHMIPSAFVLLDALPLTPNGKVDRKTLADLAPKPSGRAGRVPPRTPLEAALASVWEEILGRGEIGVHDNFFDLGGHSLLLMRAQSRVRERLGLDLPMPAVFQAPTVAGLARLAAGAPAWSIPPPEPRPRDGSPFPLSFAQERLWLLHRLNPASAAYNVAGEVRLSGPLDIAALAGALRDLARCHEVLRTRFFETQEGPVQSPHPLAPSPVTGRGGKHGREDGWWRPSPGDGRGDGGEGPGGGPAKGISDPPVVCLAALSRAFREAEAERLGLEEARRPFDLATAPPVRATLLRLEKSEHRLLLTLHHVAADEESLGILARDLGTSYEALSRGLPSPLVPPSLQIADVAVWQRERMRGEALEARLAWWEERLAGLPDLDLPTDHSRPAGPAEPDDRGGSVSAPLPAETEAGLSAFARSSGATLFMVLLAGFQAFLSRLAGAPDLAVGSPFSTRDRRELEGVVGPLLNTLVLRADLSGDPTFRELLGRVREGTVAAHERSDLPFELLVERLRPERNAGSNPLFQVMFVLHRPPAPLRAAGVEMEPRPVPTGTAKLDLSLYALERPEGISLELEHAATLWDQATADRFLTDLLTLLADVAADPGLHLSALPPLTGPERREVLSSTPDRRGAPSMEGAPRSPLQELLAGIWEDLLGVERPGLHDDFFALGGHSLLAARVVSRLRVSLGVDLPLRTLFEARTIAALASRVEAAQRDAGGSSTLLPLVRVPREGGLPLSFGQERLWFLDRLDPGSPVYNMPAAVRLSGPLDPEALRAAIAGIAGRHEVLRTAFPAPQGTPVQVAAPSLDLRLPWVDLSGLGIQEGRTEALRLASAEALLPFDLEKGPPLRATLLRLASDEHVLLVTVHHIVFDGWSLGLFLRELRILYGASEGEPRGRARTERNCPSPQGEFEHRPQPDLAALPVQYADFAVWQRQLLEGEALASSLAWWRERMAGAPPVLSLPLDRPRPPVQTFRGGSLHLSLRPEEARAVRDLGRRLEATPFMVLLAAWAALLARYSAETDLVVGTAVAGRDQPELEPLIGLFAGNLALRLDLAGDPPFAETVTQARETVLSAWAHREVPFERLVRELRPERDLSHTPLYQAVLTLDASDRPPLELPGLRVEELPVESGTAKFDLALYLEDRRDGIRGLLEFNRDLFDRATAARLLAAFERLVEAAPLVPERRVSELPVLSDAERHQALTEISGAPSPRPRNLVPRLVDARVRVTGGGRTLSQGELDRLAGGLALRLRGLGVGLEVRVAVCLDRSPELVAAMLGIWKAGGVYVPLDPTHPDGRLAWMVADSGAAAVLASRRGPAPPPGAPPVVFLEDVSPAEATSAPLFAESAAYLVYTSGSTGRPKGVVVSHGALAAYAAAVADLYRIGQGDRVLQSASPGFDLSLDEIVPCLTGGAELVMRDDAMLASPAAFLDGCRERGITVLSLPTALWHEIASSLETGGPALPPELRLVILGGERLLPERLAAWQRRFPDGPRLLNTYGPTEATVMVTATDVTAPAAVFRPEAPIGRPLSGSGIWLLGRHGEPVPPGVPGEVCIGGSFPARGYLGQPDRTAERFVPHPYSSTPGERLYRTGDLARLLPDGNLEFAGRVDEQVKVRGYRVEPGEVEAALARHPGVAAAAVVVWEDAPDRKRLVGYVAPRQPAPTASEVRAFLAASLPEPLIPSELVFLEALPLTPHGKVDRRALPAPSGRGARAEAEHVPPRTEVERAIAAVWKEVLELERVGVRDSFFDLGGHSMALARVHVLLRERLGREIPIVDLFRYPTVAALAGHLALPAAEATTPAVPEKVQQRAERSRAATRQGRFLEARKRMAENPPAQPSPPVPLSHPHSRPPGEGAPPPKAQDSFLRFVERNPEALERASFAALAEPAAASPWPLQPWPAFVDRARVAEMERVSTGLVKLVKSLPRRVFGNDPERLRDFYDLASADLARSMVEEPNGLEGVIGRGDFLDSAAGLQCLELNLVSDLGGWQAPLWAEAYLRVPLFVRFLREEGLRAACRDTVSLLFAHVAAEARELAGADGEVNIALVLPEGGAAAARELEPWLASRYAEGRLALLPYSGLRERGGRLWAGERPVHAAVEIHHEGTAAHAFRCFKAGSLKLYNAPVRTLLTDKRNLALLSDLADRGEILDPAERDLVSRHLPWTRRLAPAAASWRGREAWLPELALTAQRELVIKRAREGRGSAVHIGAATPEPVWRERVVRALADGDWVVQERVESLPSIHQLGERGCGPHDVVWGLFVFGDRYGGGFLSLAPREQGGVINLTRGASAGVIFEVLDDE
ncbi:MAG TPA: amino acid adenylation domain-containing protein [Thermoanaerobaculia bacterium]